MCIIQLQLCPVNSPKDNTDGFTKVTALNFRLAIRLLLSPHSDFHLIEKLNNIKYLYASLGSHADVRAAVANF
jgi:hypothetical protein